MAAGVSEVSETVSTGFEPEFFLQSMSWTWNKMTAPKKFDN